MFGKTFLWQVPNKTPLYFDKHLDEQTTNVTKVTKKHMSSPSVISPSNTDWVPAKTTKEDKLFLLTFYNERHSSFQST